MQNQTTVYVNKLNFLLLFTIIFSISIFPILFENSLAQNQISPRHQWKQLPDPDILTCKESLILLQKTNGSPACVSSTAYLKLVDRDYGKFDLSQLMKRPIMMTNLLNGMIEESELMFNWHTMMINDPKIIQQTMSNLVLQIKEKPDLMAHIMGPMTTNPDLRVKMIEQMKNHNHMMTSFQEHSGWMNSVHRPMMSSNMDEGMTSRMNEQVRCSWCPEKTQKPISTHPGFHQPKIMEDMLHHLWTNENIRKQMHNLMLENHDHLGVMSDRMMEPTLRNMMNDSELRQQMIEMMLEHEEFMNSIRHENRFTN